MSRNRAPGFTADHGVMRGLNRTLVLDMLRHDATPLSRAAIAKRTGLAKPTVSAIIDDLITEDLVRELGPGRTTVEGGRPPILLEFNARSRYVIGVHIGVVHTNITVADARGVELDRVQLDTPNGDADHALDRIAMLTRDALLGAQGSPDQLAAVGVCVPGLVDLHRGICLLAPNLGWRDIPVCDVLHERLGVPVFVHNTSQACAMAEMIEGAAKGANDVALLYAGTGVGSGLISARSLYRGWAGIAGEIGHCRVSSSAERCSCGKTGCLETVASAPALVRLAEARGLRAPRGETLTIEHVRAAALEGDRAARSAVSEVGTHLGTAAAWLVNLFNPEVLIVGGGLAGLGELLLGPLRHAALDDALPQTAERVSIRPWALGQDAKVRGAVLVGLDGADARPR